MKKLLLLLLFIPFVSFGQDYGNDSDALKLCTAIQNNSFISDSKADNALDRILSVIGASKRFVLQSCDNINNAVATSYKGIRYILYDRDFMDSLDSGDNWSNLFILAHEVGHHINGHSLDIILYANDIVDPKSLLEKRNQELEADEFAGFILGKLGATLKQTSSSINLISSEKDDTYSTHPSKSKRLAAIEKGYKKNLEKNTKVYETNAIQAAQEYYYLGFEKYKYGKIFESLVDFNKAIKLDPQNSKYHYNRAIIKYDLEDYNAAIEDYTKALGLIPDSTAPNIHYAAYNNRGFTKNKIKDYYGAIADLTKAIELDPNYADAYFNRGVSKDNLEDYYGAIYDYTKAIELDPNYADAYRNRGINKENLGDLTGACADWKKAASLGNTDSAKWVANQCN
tara:strand:- start:624 stop:1817 length:1194 start_codon:yes stop_codon:yes gene_type:complete